MLKHSPQIQIPQRIWHGLVLKQRFTRLFASKLASDHDNSKIIKKHFVFTCISGYLSKRRRRRRRERERETETVRERGEMQTHRPRQRDPRHRESGTDRQTEKQSHSWRCTNFQPPHLGGQLAWHQAILNDLIQALQGLLLLILRDGVRGDNLVLKSTQAIWSCPQITTVNNIYTTWWGLGGWPCQAIASTLLTAKQYFEWLYCGFSSISNSQVPLKQFQSWPDCE